MYHKDGPLVPTPFDPASARGISIRSRRSVPCHSSRGIPLCALGFLQNFPCLSVRTVAQVKSALVLRELFPNTPTHKLGAPTARGLGGKPPSP